MKKKHTKNTSSVIQDYLKNSQQGSNLTPIQEKELSQMFGGYYQHIGELLFFLERSYLPLERKVFFQAALLKGYHTDELMEQMIQEMDQATEELRHQMELLKTEVEQDGKELFELANRYAESAKVVRHFKKQLRQQFLIQTEKKIEAVSTSEEADEIQKLQAILKKKA